MIARYLPMSLAAIVQAVREEGLTMSAAEQRTIGLAHPAFGAWVMARWGLPSGLVEAVEFHHCPTKAQYAFDLAALVYLANALTHEAGIGCGGDTLPREVDPAILEHFSLGDGAVADLHDALLFKRLEIEAFASVAAAA